MSDERMDQRLNRAGEAWRATVPPAGPLGAVALDSRPPGWVAVVAAAAAVAIAATVGIWALPDGSRDGAPVVEPSTPTPTTPAYDVVPWADLPATLPTVPTRALPPPRDPRRTRPCGAEDLGVDRFVEGAGGTTYLELTFYLAIDDGCYVAGAPRVELLDHGEVLPATVRGDGVDGDAVAVVPAASASLMIGWGVSHSCAAVDNDQVRLTFRDGSTLLVRGFGPTMCNPGEAAYQVVTVQPFRDLRERARRVSLWRDISVMDIAPLDLRGSPGDVVSFEIPLISPTDVVLDPCPDFTIGRFGDGFSSEGRHGLNCAAIPHRDDQGRAMLPADTPVTFEVQVEVPPVDIPKLVWRLDAGSGSSVSVVGSITVD